MIWERDVDKGASFGKVVSHLRETLGRAFRRPRLRRIIFESMGFGGVFAATKDYLQPVLKAAAVVYVVAAAAKLGLLPAGAEGGAATAGLARLNEPQTAAILVGPVYFVLYLRSALASRRASSATVRPRGRVPAIGRSSASSPSTRTIISGEDPARLTSPHSRKNMYGEGLIRRNRR